MDLSNITPFVADEAVSRDNFNKRVDEVNQAVTATNVAVTANTAAIASIPSTPLTMTAKLTAGGTQDLATKQVRNITISPNDPIGGVNGDMWFKYS